MPVDTALDFTPNFTPSTLQFQSETLNVVVISLLIVLILVNIGSAISKLVFLQRHKSFSFHSWLRAFIFTNSDDPLRLFSWLSHRYEYRQPHWNRYPTKLRYRRLLLPLLARATILIVSFISVGITIPQNKQLQGCDNGDYALVFNPADARFTEILSTVCIDIPLTTNLGSVFATASYCNCPIVGRASLAADISQVHVSFDATQSMLSTVLTSNSTIAGSLFYVEWKQQHNQSVRLGQQTLRSDIVNSLDTDTHARIAVNAVMSEVQGCTAGEFQVHEDRTVTVDLGGCMFDAVNMIGRVDSYIRNALEWRRLPRIQPRLKYQRDASEGAEAILDCAVPVIVVRPVVNIVPLGFVLVGWVIVNFVVSKVVSKRGNSLDAAFHIIKEALGHDTTCNPLEECVGRREITDVELRNWKCGNGEGHVGFIGREGDVAVEEFEDGVVVCGCGKAKGELEFVKGLNGGLKDVEYDLGGGDEECRVRRGDLERGAQWFVGESSDGLMETYYSPKSKRGGNGSPRPGRSTPSSLDDDAVTNGAKRREKGTGSREFT